MWLEVGKLEVGGGTSNDYNMIVIRYQLLRKKTKELQT